MNKKIEIEKKYNYEEVPANLFDNNYKWDFFMFLRYMITKIAFLFYPPLEMNHNINASIIC